LNVEKDVSKFLDDKRGILKDGNRLFHYAEEIIGGKSPRLWRKFEKICLTQSLIQVEALYESIVMLPDYKKCKASMENAGKTYTLANHLEQCISTWIYYRKLRGEYPEWKPKKQAFIYYTKDGKIKAIFIEKIYPLCSRCRKELALDLYGRFYCFKCYYKDC